MSTPVTRLANYAADSASALPISSAEVDSEMNAWVAALNRKVVAKSTAPSSPVAGDTWVDTTNNIMWFYSGSAWVEIPSTTTASNGQILQYNGTHWVAVNSSSGNAVQMTDAHSVATATRARDGSNVATITTGTAHGLTNGDKVDINAVSGTRYNTVGATVTVTNSTTFTYASTGSLETQTADVGGTVKSSLTVDASAGSFFYATLTGNRFIQTPTNPTAWQKVIFIITQDSTGGRTISLGTGFQIDAILGATLTIVLTASKVCYFGAIYNGNTTKWDVLAVSGALG